MLKAEAEHRKSTVISESSIVMMPIGGVCSACWQPCLHLLCSVHAPCLHRPDPSMHHAVLCPCTCCALPLQPACTHCELPPLCPTSFALHHLLHLARLISALVFIVCMVEHWCRARISGLQAHQLPDQQSSVNQQQSISSMSRTLLMLTDVSLPSLILDLSINGGFHGSCTRCTSSTFHANKCSLIIFVQLSLLH